MSVRLECPLCGTTVVDGQEPGPGACPSCGAAYAGGGDSPPAAAEMALATWGIEGVDPGALTRRLFEAEPAPPPAPTAAITSDRREGFYRWWLFARGGAEGVRAAMGG